MTNQSFATKIPDNTSLLQATKFTFIFPNLPFARYFCQTVSVPGVETTPVAVPNPFADIYRHGDKLVYQDFQINAIIDEDLRVWEETFNWIKSLTKPENFGQYARSRNPNAELYYDAILTINTNANNPNLRVKFRNCHPISLGSVLFNTADNAETILTADITFRYDTFEFERLST
jgi:hypothetical protein